MCGLPGAGKTTRAIELERSLPALRLTPDEWITRVLGPEPPQASLDAARDPFESLQWDVAARALTLGIDVILDFGFWSRTERDDVRERASALGAVTCVHFVDTPLDVLHSRLAKRVTDNVPNTFRVTPEQLNEWNRLFEPPTADELLPPGPRPAS
jgi:predicted kinase